MTAGYHRRSITLGFHPTARGFGWAAFDAPFHVYDHGLFTAKKDKNAKCLKKLADLLDRLSPETIILEVFDKTSSVRSPRIRKLCLQVVKLAADRGLELTVYRRSDVQTCFAAIGARTRDEIAAAVVRQVGALRYHLPDKRRPHDSEDKRLAIFAAAALVITHYEDGALSLLSSSQLRQGGGLDNRAPGI